MPLESHIAKTVTCLFHPLLLPSYSCALLYWGGLYPFIPLGTPYFLLILSIFLCFSFVFPSLSIYILYQKKAIATLKLQNRKERTLPYLITIVFMWMGISLLRNIAIIDDFLFIIYNAFAILFAALLINYRLKISAHMLGMGSFTAYSLLLYKIYNPALFPLFLTTILASGLVAHARLHLKEHSNKEVYLGYGIGIILTFAVYFVL